MYLIFSFSNTKIQDYIAISSFIKNRLTFLFIERGSVLLTVKKSSIVSDTFMKIYMSGFMKAVIKKKNMCSFDFTTLKGLKITPDDLI